MKYKYKAKNTTGETLSGEIEAHNDKEAIEIIESRQMIPIEIQAILNSEKLSIHQKVSKKNVKFFTEQLSDLLASGVNLLQAIDLISQQVSNERMRLILDHIFNALRDGSSLSGALEKFPNVFDSFYINMVKSGEMSGSLDQVLNRLNDFFEKEEEIKSKIITALVYPAFILFVGLGAILILLTLVVPRITSIFAESGQSLPLPTELLLWVSHIFQKFWWGFFGFILFLYFIYKKQIQKPAGKLFFHQKKLRIPILGVVHRDEEVSKFTRSMAILISNGLPVLNALTITKDIVQNELLKLEVQSMIDFVKKGKHLSDFLQESKVFPPNAVSMISVGEASGHLDQSLNRISITYEKIVDRSIKTITSMLEPVLILIIGIAVASIVFAMLLPILQMNMIAF